jgi:hypothetical protein
MSDTEETAIVNDAITSDDAGFSSDAGNQTIEEAVVASETEAEGSEATTSEVQADTVEELKEEVENAIEEGATQEEVQNMVKEFKLKVNGKEYTKKIDLSDEDAVKRELQLAMAGQSAMQREKELQKAQDDAIKRFIENPWDTFEEHGLDADELAESRLRQKVDEMKKSPDQRAKEQLERELAEARNKLQETQREAENARMMQLEGEEAARLETEITQALDAHTTLPNSPKVVQKIADTLLWAEEEGYKDLSVKDILPTVEAELRDEVQHMMNQLPEEMMEEYIGKKNLERLRNRRLVTKKPNNISNVKPTTEEVKVKEKKERRAVRSKDYFRNL